ncbi:MAG: hypothetical protein J0L75_07190 [Spirochaetes bacterium]|nr:hypothetical protein [Spirochaetota bacterium]
MNSPFSRSVAVCLALFTLAWAGETQGARAERGTPVIDGAPTEAVWSSAKRYGDFVKLGLAEPASVATEFSVLYDDENLYFGVRCRQPMAALAARSRTRDHAGIFADDSVEIFLNPFVGSGDAQVQRYFQIAVSVSGAWYDTAKQRGDLGTVLEEPSWNPDLRVRTALGAEGWSAEIAIPLAPLGLGRAHGGSFAMNLTRNWQGVRPTEWSTWARLSRKNFNLPDEFPRLEGIDADFAPYRWELSGILLGAPQRGPAGLVVPCHFELENLGASERNLEITARLTAANGSAVERTALLSVKPGRQGVDWPLEPRIEGLHDLEVWGRDPATGRDGLYAIRGKNRIYDSLLEVALTAPAYRNAFFSDENSGKVEGEATVNLEESRLKSHALRLGFTGPTGKSLDLTVDLAGKRTPWSLAVGALEEGAYRLSVELVRRADLAVLAAVTNTIRKLPRQEGEVRYDRDRNAMRVDGKPFLPVGWYGAGDSEADFDRLPATHFNMLYNGVAIWKGAAGTLAFLDKAKSRGLKFMTWLYPNDRMLKEKLKDVDHPSKEILAEIAAFMAAVRSHPALLGWYIADEPEYNRLRPSCLEDIYRLAREVDPHHPVVMLNCTAPAIREYRDGGDILMPDPYPAFYKEPLASRVDIEKVAEFVSIAKAANLGRGPVWVTPEAFTYANEPAFKDRRYPTFDEERAMSLLALVHGATGFCYFSYPSHLNAPELFVGMPALAEELQALAPVILDGERVAVSSSSKEVQAACWRLGTAYTLIAVHTREGSVEATLTVHGGPGGAWTVGMEERSAVFSGGALREVFGPAAARVYTTGKPATRRTATSIRKEIAEHGIALGKKGNLAFGGGGAKVACSAPATADTLSSVVDGCTQPRSMGITFRGAPSAQNPQWVEVTFPKRATVGRVVLHAMLPEFVWKLDSPYLFDYRLSWRDGAAWTPLAEGSADRGMIEIAFPPVATESLWVEFVKSRGRIDLVEVEAYGK